MFENPLILSMILGLISSISYLLLYKTTDEYKYNKNDKQILTNQILIFISIFICTYIYNVCYHTIKYDNNVIESIISDNINSSKVPF